MPRTVQSFKPTVQRAALSIASVIGFLLAVPSAANAGALPAAPLNMSPPTQHIALGKTSRIAITWKIAEPTKILWGGRDIGADILLKTPNDYWKFAPQSTVAGTIGTRAIEAKNCTIIANAELRCKVGNGTSKIPYEIDGDITFNPKVTGKIATHTNLSGGDNLIRYWNTENPALPMDADAYYYADVK